MRVDGDTVRLGSLPGVRRGASIGRLASGLLFLLFIFRGSPRPRIWGTAVDSAAFQELIALARDTAAEVAATEKKVSAFKDELAHQDHRAQPNASPAIPRPITITPKTINSGWIPAGKPSTARRTS
jgi:hypothetical protein